MVRILAKPDDETNGIAFLVVFRKSTPEGGEAEYALAEDGSLNWLDPEIDCGVRHSFVLPKQEALALQDDLAFHLRAGKAVPQSAPAPMLPPLPDERLVEAERRRGDDLLGILHRVLPPCPLPPSTPKP